MDILDKEYNQEIVVLSPRELSLLAVVVFEACMEIPGFEYKEDLHPLRDKLLRYLYTNCKCSRVPFMIRPNNINPDCPIHREVLEL